MKNFGNKDFFAVEYELSVPNAKGIEINNSIGCLKLWINGADMLSYRYNGKTLCFKGILFYIVDWFFDKMEYIIGYDEFPLPVEGENSLELTEKSNIDIEDETELDLWYTAKDRWVSNHSWFSVISDCVIPNMYFRRVNDNVEISWNNDFWKNREIEFSEEKGIFVLSLDEFKNVIFSFLQEITNDFMSIYENRSFAEDWKNKAFFELKISRDHGDQV